MLTPNKAAKVLGVSRRTIMRMITSNEIRASKTNSGWLVDPASVTAAQAAHGRAHAQMPTLPTPAHPDTARANELEMTLALREAEIGLLKARVGDLEADRDAWRTQAQDLARKPLATPPEAPAERTTGWLGWLRRKG